MQSRLLFNLSKINKIIIIDDEPSIYLFWKNLFCEVTEDVVHISKPDYGLEYLKSRDLQNTLVICDNYFGSSECILGVQLISQIKIPNLIFSSSSKELISIFKNIDLSENSIFLPKDHLLKLKIENNCLFEFQEEVYSDLTKLKLVLIDDDLLVHMTWKLYFERKNINIEIFKSVDEFLQSESSGIVEETKHIFIDSDLKNNTVGEIEAKKILNLGYQQIYLSTGSSEFKRYYPNYIKKVFSKSPIEIHNYLEKLL